MELGIDDCCKDKKLNEVCGMCRYGLMAYYLENQGALMQWTRDHNPRLWKEVKAGKFEL